MPYKRERTRNYRAAESFAKKYKSDLDGLYSKVIDSNYSVNSGVDRSAIVQQVALFRARAQGKNN